MSGDARHLKLLRLDVDGVLTDGTILLHQDGRESKAFHIRDGAGDGLGAARRSEDRPALGSRLGSHFSESHAAGHHARRPRGQPNKLAAYEG